VRHCHHSTSLIIEGSALARNGYGRPSPDPFADEDLALVAFPGSAPDEDGYVAALDPAQPSLLVIVLSAACGIAGGVVALYLCYIVLDVSVQLTAFAVAVGLCLGLGLAGAGFSALTGNRAALKNIVFSCALITVTALFLGVCMLVGAVAALLLIRPVG
jgi:hypothetical protein